jgi:four helix bundle protein
LSLDVMKAFTPQACRPVPDLRRQAIRAANSIVDCLSEGCGKRSPRELARFADMALGSTVELRGQIIRARDMRLIPQHVADRLEAQVEEVRKMLYALARSVRQQHGPRDEPPSLKPRDSQY